MQEKHYNIAFGGKAAQGHNIEEVKRNLASIFKLEGGKVEQLFTGKKHIIKKNIPYQSVMKYKRAFEKAGAICEIRAVEIHGTPAPHSVTCKNEALTPYDQEKMICPVCAHIQQKSIECQNCGIVIDKCKKRTEHARAALLSPGSSPSKRKSTHRSSKTAVIIPLLAIVLVLYFVSSWWKGRPISHGPGMVAPNTPEQIETDIAPFAFKDYWIIPLANFQIKARVLSTRKYRSGRESDLSPIDLALGWGPMSDEAVLEDVKIRQSSRFYFWSTREFPIPRREIEIHSANMHIVPASEVVLRRLNDVRKGHIVDFTGYLVKITANDGWRWKSSLTRNDTGSGGCELVWVEELETL